ncbi:E3 ubiquitin-protein ligase MIB2-like isoform X3 [Octopus vulgaris]|uniref:E3 ubiquitin-protein ligase MIB2-like isoform X3 n=1 Tax=Octopus vulgaris TaxID=6645 RepID=A0AA36HJ82_OCTVU|nr:E3 ubiquitin-protein ligase MIB2-like isoform X3 [Octopus vulgaris]
MDPIVNKICNNDVEGLKILLEEEPGEINKPIDRLGRTPLMEACYKGADRRIIDILIDAGGQIGAKDNWGRSALHLAVKGKHLQAVELLLSRGSNVNEKTNSGYTPLHLAANSCREWTNGVKAIMNQSAVEVNTRNANGQTPLHRACYWGNLHIVDILLGHNGIDANVVDKEGDTPLHVAVRGRKYKVVCAMLKQDSVNLEIVNKKYRTPLLEAVSNGHLGIMQRLIARGANVNVVEHGGNNCLHLALKRENNFHSEVEHMTMLDQFCVELKLGNEERCSGVVVASYLAHHGANFYCKNKIGRTPLDLIEEEDLKKMLKTLFSPHHDGGRRMDQALKGPIRCVFCEDEVATETFFPCKHLSLCKKCCPPKIPKQCLKCGQKITSKNSLVGPNSSKMEVQMVAGPVVSPKFEDKGVQSDAQLLGATSKQGGEYKIPVPN